MVNGFIWSEVMWLGMQYEVDVGSEQVVERMARGESILR